MTYNPKFEAWFADPERQRRYAEDKDALYAAWLAGRALQSEMDTRVVQGRQ